MKYSFIVLSLCLVLFTGTSHAQNTLHADTALLIDKIFSDRNEHAPGVVLAIGRGGKLIYNKGFGMASLESGIKHAPESMFEVGSVSKQFTATAILLLEQEGKLSFDDDIRKYIPEMPDYGAKITIRHLLTHTSGLRDWRNMATITGWPTGTKLYSQYDAFQMITSQRGLNFPVGEQYSYSNANYDLLPFIVEKVTGKKFLDYENEHVMKPVQLQNARWRTDRRLPVPHKVTPYNKINNKYLITEALENTHGAAGILSTAADLVKWNAYWAEGRFGEKASASRIIRAKLNNGKEITYALGAVNVQKYYGQTEITHGGLLTGYRALLTYFPELDMSVACLSNDRTISLPDVQKHLAKIFWNADTASSSSAKNYQIPAAALKSRAGLYKNTGSYNKMEFEVVADSALKLKGGSQLKNISSDTLERSGVKYVFKGDQLELWSGGSMTSYLKVMPYKPSSKALETYTGTYYSADVDVKLDVKASNGKLIAYRNENSSFELRPSFTTKDKVGFYGLDAGLAVLVEFDRLKSPFEGFLLSIPRAEHIRFEKK